MEILISTQQKGSNICPNCGKKALILDVITDEIFCYDCGFVVGEVECKALQSKVSIQTSINNIGASTIIGQKDAYGHIPSKVKLYKLRAWDIRSVAQGYTQRSLKRALLIMERISDKLAISDKVIERAFYIYRKAIMKGLIRGRAALPFIVAAIYIACRDAGVVRSLKEIAKASGVEVKKSSKSYRILINEIGLKAPSINPEKWVSAIVSKVGLSEKIRRITLNILREVVDNLEFIGKVPIGIAAAAIYMAALKDGELVLQKDIAKAAGITTVTLRNRYRDLQRLLSKNNLN